MAMKASCDACAMTKELNMFAALPAGWLRFTIGVPAPDPDVTVDFCSWRCARDYAQKQMIASSEQTPTAVI